MWVCVKLCSPELKMAKLLLSSIHCYQLHNIFCCLIQNFNYTCFEFFSETLIAFYNVTQKCAFTNAKYQCAFRNWFQMPKKTPNYIVLMKYFNKLMHELFLRHTKSRNTIVKRWEWCWLQSWQGQVAFWSAWLGIFYNISACHQQAWATLWLFSLDLSAPENLH